MYSKWISFFSQTGSEIVAISHSLGRWPDYIITNRTDDEGINPEILHAINFNNGKKGKPTLIKIPKWPKR